MKIKTINKIITYLLIQFTIYVYINAYITITFIKNSYFIM